MSYDKPEPPPYTAYPNSPYAAPITTAYPNSPYGAPVATGYAMPVVANVDTIRDYLAWSIVNLFCGWGIGGILPLIFSILCRNQKAMNDYSGAQTMSTLALVFNILVTLGGVIAWVTFIAVMAVYIAALNSIH